MHNRTDKSVLIGLMLLGLLPSLSAQSDQAREFDGYIVHYNAVTTDFLRPEVAQAHGIVRSRNRVLLNVSIQAKTVGAAAGRALRATVSARATNLNGQLKTIAMREVRDGDAIYYLGEIPVADKEVLDFTAKVTPEGETRAYTIEFRKQFFARDS